MSKGKKHIDLENYRRYRNNQMTGAERNTFEKEVQKDPFAAEAMEGFDLLDNQTIAKDLKELNDRILISRKKKTTPYLAAAATILLLISAGIIWIQLENKNPLPHLSETKVEEKIETVRPAEEEMLEEIEEKTEAVLDEKSGDIQTDKAGSDIEINESDNHEESIAETKQQVRIEKAAIPVKKETELVILEMEDQSLEPDEEILFAAPKSKMEAARPDKNLESVVQGVVVSADDRQPIPGVSVTIKGTDKGVITDLAGRFNLPVKNDSSATLIASFVGMETHEFQPDTDSNLLIELEPSQLALDEVVVVGYGSKQKKQVTGSVQVVKTEPQNSEAVPSVGYDEYYKYLNENAILPSEYPEQKLVVKVKLELDANGNIIRILNANKTNEEYFTKAKTLIENNSGWQPKYFNDRQVKSSVKLRIVFRKAEYSD
ncbi:carboxypeptidase-like regulatory domain-containing protein [uncultured Draconibacterium sp.]|uniref:carboxypeptidase-like regulatory domain-containing protein n=1 Tax=uncultured Draconibacterium sp. TaxID=1573823 RepID=UPI0032170A88